MFNSAETFSEALLRAGRANVPSGSNYLQLGFPCSLSATDPGYASATGQFHAFLRTRKISRRNVIYLMEMLLSFVVSSARARENGTRVCSIIMRVCSR